MRKIAFPEFVVIWNQAQSFKTPKLHVEICRWFEARWNCGDRELLLLAFRDSGKSTLVGLFSAWLLMDNPNTRILVLAADFALARKMVRNVKRIIERHPLTRGLKPARRDQWAAEQFTVNRSAELRDPSMLAKGIGANVTGSRADVVICDDVEVPNTCDTAPKREDLRERLSEIDYVLVPGGLQLFIGTPHTYYSIYAESARADAGETRPFLDGFVRLERAILDETGASRWPERFSDDKIKAMRRRAGPNKFSSQMLLRPVNIAEGRLDPDRLRVYDTELDYHEGNGEAVLRLGGKQLLSASCWWDPSYGSPDAGDASVIAAVFTDEDGDYRLHRVRYLQHDPARIEETDEATQMCLQVIEFVRENYLPAVVLETNGLGRFLPGLLRREIAKAGLQCAVVETTSRRNKDLRIIEAFDAVLAASRLHAYRSIWQTPFVTEMREWRPASRGRDDGLDAVSGCLSTEPVRLPRVAPAGTGKPRDLGIWRTGGQSYRAETDFMV